jgi:uncharacterized protein YneF (UPF0154 family)
MELFSILTTVFIVIISVVVLYLIYGFVYGSSATMHATKIVTTQFAANSPPINLPTVSGMYEGGDYAVSLWVYISSYNINRNQRKHVLEIGGTNFSTLLIALGAFKNSLMVRTQSRDNETIILSDNSGAGPSTDTANTMTTSTPGSDEATRLDGSLTADDLNAMFKPLAMDDSLINPMQICDIDTIDMQRWINITVVLSGRTIDVYLDGKLTRSCVSRSYYKVDPTGVKIKLADRGGFDGYMNGINTYNYSLSPSDVYRIYEAGPTGASAGVGNLFTSLFTAGK